MKTRIITWLITFGAFLETAYTVFSENQGVLEALGVNPKLTKIVMLAGLLWNAFSKSLSEPKLGVQKIGGTNPPPNKDEK